MGIDSLAGPSELAVVATATAPTRELIALDLLAQAEHGEDSRCCAALAPTATCATR